MLRVLRLYLKVAIFQPELREHAPHTTSVLKSCDFPAGAAGARSAPRTTFVLKAAIFKPELPRTRGESNPGPRDCESRRAHHETTSKSRFASKKIARRHSESASTRTISAEGSSGSRTAPQREPSDTHDDPRRGFIGLKTDAHGATARAIRHARSPQRVHRAHQQAPSSELHWSSLDKCLATSCTRKAFSTQAKAFSTQRAGRVLLLACFVATEEVFEANIKPMGGDRSHFFSNCCDQAAYVCVCAYSL